MKCCKQAYNYTGRNEENMREVLGRQATTNGNFNMESSFVTGYSLKRRVYVNLSILEKLYMIFFCVVIIYCIACKIITTEVII